MAEEKLEKTAQKAEKPKKKKDGLFKRFGNFIVDCKSELKKVVWLSWPDTVKKSGVVLVMMVATGVAIGVADFVLTKLILLLGNLL
jgi:preprotein translocase SecE subunit